MKKRDLDKIIDEAFERQQVAEVKLTPAFLREMIEQVMDQPLPKKIINEKLNEGDVVEGIFAIAVALNLAYDKVDPSAVEEWRKKIEPALYRKERQVMTIADLSDVETKDRKIRRFKEEILTNGRRDAVIFTVVADGLEGETSGGNLKGDVMLRVQASESAEGDFLDIVGAKTQEVAFSIKSGSKTVANLSVYKGLVALGEAWGISGFSQNVKKYANIINRKTDQKEKAQLIAAMFADFAEQLDAMDKTPEFSQKVFKFLSDSIFGDDLADVVDITKSGIHEVTLEGFNKLMEQGITFDVIIGKQRNGDPIIHFFREGSTDKADKLFHLRTKIRVDEDGRLKEAKLYPELGPLAYSVSKH